LGRAEAEALLRDAQASDLLGRSDDARIAARMLARALAP
jgi:hypothetical protein